MRLHGRVHDLRPIARGAYEEDGEERLRKVVVTDIPISDRGGSAAVGLADDLAVQCGVALAAVIVVCS